MHPNRTKYLKVMEMGGILFGALFSLFAQKLYTFSDRGLVGVLFGAVNDSPWEIIKTILLPFFLWGVLELLALQPSLHKLTAAKTASLYLVAGILLAGSCVLYRCGIGTNSAAFTAVCLIALSAGAAFSILIYHASFEANRFFAPCIFLLFLFLACYFSLTPFPPQSFLFRDSRTGIYGLIPDYLDIGAYVMTYFFKKR